MAHEEDFAPVEGGAGALDLARLMAQKAGSPEDGSIGGGGYAYAPRSDEKVHPSFYTAYSYVGEAYGMGADDSGYDWSRWKDQLQIVVGDARPTGWWSAVAGSVARHGKPGEPLAETVLRFILERYSSLPNVMVAAAELPPEPDDGLRRRMHQLGPTSGFVALCGFSRGIDVSDKGAQTIREVYLELMGESVPVYLPTTQTRLFAIGRKRLLARPRSFYRRALEIAQRGPAEAAAIESLWEFLFAGGAQTAGVVTAINAAYVSAFQLLHASLQTNGDYPVAIYDVGLHSEHRTWIRRLDGVTLLSPPDLPPEVDRLRHHGFAAGWLKPFWLHNAPFDRALWIDADCVATMPLGDAFAQIDDRPLVARDPYWDVTRNDPRLYDHWPLPAGAHRPSLAINSGLVGIDRRRDAAFLGAWLWGVAAVGQQPWLEQFVRFCDQGVALWALQRCGLGDQVQANASWNTWGRRDFDYLRVAARTGGTLLDAVKAKHPGAKLVHWMGPFKLPDLIAIELSRTQL